MFFTSRSRKALETAANQVAECVRTRSYYDGIKIGITAMQKYASDAGLKEYRDVKRNVGVTFLLILQVQIDQATIENVTEVIAASQEADMAERQLRQVFEDEEQLGHRNSATVYYLSKLLVYRRRFEDADHVTRGAEASPLEDADFYAVLGQIADHFHRRDDVRRLLRKASALDPSHWWVRITSSIID